MTINILYGLSRFHTHPTRILRNLEGLQVVIAPTMHKNAFAQTHQHPTRGNVPTILHDGLTQERTRLGRYTARRIKSIRAKSAYFCFIIGRKRHPTAFAIKFPQYRGRRKNNVNRILAIALDLAIQINGHRGKTTHQRIHTFHRLPVHKHLHVSAFPLLDFQKMVLVQLRFLRRRKQRRTVSPIAPFHTLAMHVTRGLFLMFAK